MSKNRVNLLLFAFSLFVSGSVLSDLKKGRNQEAKEKLRNIIERL